MEDIEQVFESLKTRPEPFRNELARLVYYRTYSRWLEDRGRRENWHETVERYCRFLFELGGHVLSEDEKRDIVLAVYDHEVAGSNRLLWSAGDACRKNPMTAYNCSALDLDCIEAFAEVMFILMSGTGVGVSVEKDVVRKLPSVEYQREYTITHYHVVRDSREGWADSLKLGLQLWFSGCDIEFNFKKVRPKGSRLSTMGGRASGPAPLEKLLNFTRDIVLGAQGRKLRPIEVADIVNMIGEVVVAGGVRRSAEILLFSPDDKEMLNAKSGEFWLTSPHRSMSNNSAVFSERPPREEFDAFWQSVSESGTGEPGLFNRSAWNASAPRRKNWDRTLTNPCGEISLRSMQTCNLSTVVLRPEDTSLDMFRKVRLATILGTLQSLVSNFTYLRPQWTENQDEERLLGVSFTGLQDIGNAFRPSLLSKCKEIAINTNKEFAARLGINRSAAATTVKPEGTTSQYTDTSSGIHPRWANYYIRRVRLSSTDPLLSLIRHYELPVSPEVGQNEESATTWVVDFPVKAPNESLTRKDVSAMDQLQCYMTMREQYTEHNPSCTVYVKPEEWAEVGKYVYENFSKVQGLSFLPRQDHIYRLAPYEEITEELYEELVSASTGSIDYSLLSKFELEDSTEGGKSYACQGGQCEI